MVVNLVTPADILDVVNSPFKEPKKIYYFGKLAYGTPYMYPRGFNQNIISIRKLKLASQEQMDKCPYKHLTKDYRFSNMPMIRRCKNWIIKSFNNYYWLSIGLPFAIKKVSLGWKWKYDDIRYEWSPSFQIYFFYWQFCIFWESPDISVSSCTYYEMYLNYKKKYHENIEEAKKNWGWIDGKTRLSTWRDNLIKHEQ